MHINSNNAAREGHDEQEEQEEQEEPGLGLAFGCSQRENSYYLSSSAMSDGSAMSISSSIADGRRSSVSPCPEDGSAFASADCDKTPTAAAAASAASAALRANTAYNAMNVTHGANITNSASNSTNGTTATHTGYSQHTPTPLCNAKEQQQSALQRVEAAVAGAVASVAPEVGRATVARVAALVDTLMSQPHRTYHTTEHVFDLFDAPGAEPEATLAALLHDAVYVLIDGPLLPPQVAQAMCTLGLVAPAAGAEAGAATVAGASCSFTSTDDDKADEQQSQREGASARVPSTTTGCCDVSTSTRRPEDAGFTADSTADSVADVYVEGEPLHVDVLRLPSESDAPLRTRMAARIFGCTLGEPLPVAGRNEFLSALLAADAYSFLSDAVMLRVLVYIEATIPFRPLGWVAALAARARAAALESGVTLTAAQADALAADANALAHRDVGNFAAPDARFFLINTWRLFSENNATLRSPLGVQGARLADWSTAVLGTLAFFDMLAPERVFHPSPPGTAVAGSSSGQPAAAAATEAKTAAAYALRSARCERNLAVGRLYVAAHGVAAAVLAALAAQVGVPDAHVADANADTTAVYQAVAVAEADAQRRGEGAGVDWPALDTDPWYYALAILRLGRHGSRVAGMTSATTRATTMTATSATTGTSAATSTTGTTASSASSAADGCEAHPRRLGRGDGFDRDDAPLPLVVAHALGSAEALRSAATVATRYSRRQLSACELLQALPHAALALLAGSLADGGLAAQQNDLQRVLEEVHGAREPSAGLVR